MNKTGKVKIYVIGGTAGLIILVLCIIMVFTAPFRRQIPSPPDLQSLSIPLQDQISYASGKAKRIPTADRLGFLGMVYHSSTYYEKAFQCYKLAAQKNSSKWIWNYYLGYLDKEMGNTEAAVESFNEVIKKDPANNLALYYIGEGYQDMGQNDKAERAFDKIVQRPENNSSPKNTTRMDYYSLRTYAMFQLSRIFLSTQRTDLAEKTLKEITVNQPTYGPAYRLLGNVYKMRGELTLSGNYITRANELKNLTTPVDTLADRLALISRSELFILKQIDDAEKNAYPVWSIQLIDNALKYIPNNKYLISKAIKIFLLLDLKKDALQHLDKHLHYFGDDISEIKMVADMLMKKELYEESKKYYKLAAKLQPDDIDVQLSLILCLGYEGLRQQALDSMNKLHGKNPKNLKVLSDGVYIMLMLGEKDKASSYLADLRKLSPEDPKGQQLEGILLEQSGKFQEALIMYESSYKGNPEDLTTARHLCDLLLKLNKWDRSIQCYRTALEYHPNEPFLLDGLATLLVFCPDPKLRNIIEGREYAERAFMNKASPLKILISSGRCCAEAYAATGDNKKAFTFMSDAINLARRDKAPPEVIEDLERRLGQFTK